MICRIAGPELAADNRQTSANFSLLMVPGTLKANLIQSQPDRVFAGSVRASLVAAPIIGDALRCALLQSISNRDQPTAWATTGPSLTRMSHPTTTRSSPT